MTILPFYEPRILEMRLEKYAEIAIDGGLWSVGEVLAQDLPMKHGFAPDPCYVYKPRHLQAAITELCRINEELRHRIFIAGFLTLPDNGAQATFRRLLATHAQMLNEAFRIEWRRRYSEVIDVSEPLRSTVTVTKEMLHKPEGPG
jgi:hypothetical protein